MAPSSTNLGSPPLTRERPNAILTEVVPIGITPAYAGKTTPDEIAVEKKKDHPRLRGKDKEQTMGNTIRVGSPPLTRERHPPGILR